MPRSRISFEDFRHILAEELMLPEEVLTPEASLIQDLHVDSLALVSMMLRLEEMGVSIPMESAWEIETVGDAYRVYLESVDVSDAKGDVPSLA
jgi:acyl carrier protein